jgi:LPS-assembly protein
MLLAWPVASMAQTAAPDLAQSPETVPAPAPEAAAEGGEQVDFSADQVTYEGESEIVAATGSVRMSRDGNYLAADQVVWNRDSGEVRAIGNVVLITPEGDKLVGDNVVLTDSLRDGTVANLLIVLESGGRIAAARGTRSGQVTTLENAIYSPCPVTDANGCPRRPSWSITAARVINDPVRDTVRFQGGRLQLFGINLPLLPIFTISQGEGGAGGWLVPDFSFSTKKGLEIAVPYHKRFGPNRDLTITPHLYTGVWPALEAKYRELNRLGAFQLSGFATYGKIESAELETATTQEDSSTERGLRAYFEANGRLQLNPLWSITGSLRAASDKTVTRRYDLTRDDRLRNVINAERISPDSYVSIAGWAFQGLRAEDDQQRIPVALPAIDARWRVPRSVFGGTVEVQANSLSILRVDGQDTQRAFASARWDLRRLTPWGQELKLTAYSRGDVYHTDEAAETSVSIYRGENGWHGRLIGALAADLRWPLIGPLFGGLQRLSPRAQLVLTPPSENLAIPNEDARSVDLEDSNLFALNRFPGYDRWEDSSRVTYGVDWAFDLPKLSVTTTIGQSYRLARRSIFPEGTGLTDRLSDFVGRTRVRYGRFIDLTHRFRLDKDNLAPRRNELDLTVGSEQTYVQVGYLRLNRNIDPLIEDLRDKEELRLAGRVLFARYWSIFGATVLDLTDRDEDPLSISDGFAPVRHRLGVAYEDDCIELGVSLRRDYEQIGSFSRATTFALRLALKGLGR